eukprot:TRINITY_DN5812_c0_g1_i1.p1 TRINITY_DN5812_c0_g1~~TRINITY_DN5812_c0_g1_i1.p1  ORF type:complete len:483 (-),score=120.02 TRINITY_DN5812_c0_g1_i1:1056-2417(-)
MSGQGFAQQSNTSFGGSAGYSSFATANDFADSLFAQGGGDNLFPAPPQRVPASAPSPFGTPSLMPAPSQPAFASTPSMDGSAFFEVYVDDPQKVGGTLKGHVTYRVNAKTNLTGYRSGTIIVRRRFNDFKWLVERLQERNPGFLVPPLPEPKVMLDQYNPEFVEERRRHLELFLKRVVRHSHLRNSADLKGFLTATDDELLQAIAQTKSLVSGAPDPKQLLGRFTSFFARKDNAADQRVDESSSYASELKSRLNKIAGITKDLVKNRKEVASDMSRLAGATLSLGEKEAIDIRAPMQALGGAFQRLAELNLKLAEHEHSHFRDTIKDCGRTAGAVEEMIKGRTAVCDKYTMAARELEEERSKLTRLTQRGDSQAAPMSVRLTEQEARVAQMKEEQRIATESCVQETARFHAEKFDSMKAMLVELVQAHIENAQQALVQFQQLLPVVQNMQYQF